MVRALLRGERAVSAVSIVGPDDPDFFEDDADPDCPNCGGEGVVHSCFTDYACVDPESGCDDCERECDWCGGRG